MSLFGGGGDQSRQIFSSPLFSPLLKKLTDVHHHLSITTTFGSTWTTFTWVRQQTVFCKKSRFILYLFSWHPKFGRGGGFCLLFTCSAAAVVYRSFCLPIILLMIWLLRWCGSILSLSHFYLKYVNCSRSKRQLDFWMDFLRAPSPLCATIHFHFTFFLQKDLLFLSSLLLCVWLTSLFFATEKSFLFFDDRRALARSKNTSEWYSSLFFSSTVQGFFNSSGGGGGGGALLMTKNEPSSSSFYTLQLYCYQITHSLCTVG